MEAQSSGVLIQGLATLGVSSHDPADCRACPLSTTLCSSQDRGWGTVRGRTDLWEKVKFKKACWRRQGLRLEGERVACEAVGLRGQGVLGAGMVETEV